MIEWLKSVQAFALFILAFGLFAMSYVDHKIKEIPDEFVIGFLFTGIIIRLYQVLYYGNIDYLFSGFVAATLLFVICFAFYYIGFWQGGDVKVIAALGMITGTEGAVWFMEGLLITDLIWHFFYRNHNAKKEGPIPYGSAISLSFIFAMIMSHGGGLF